jgi:uncharacterized repeat protein (TIGR03803 family)
MTAFGGTYGFGTIFKIKADGTGYIKLLDFVDSTSGKDPEASLVYDGTYMYGMTNWGGANNVGTIFKIKTDGSGYIKLLDFPGYPSGSRPHGGLISDGTYFYGMTMYGGVNGFGDVFKIKPDGSGYSIIHSFPSTIGGSSPWGSLLYDGTYLYGMTFYGGVNNYGTIFKIKPDATGFINMLDFADVANGALPYGSLISDGTFLYGMASSGGANSYGTLFKYSLAIGINEIDDPKLLSLSPNPFTGFIFVKSADVNKNQTFSITLSDLSGKILLHQKTSSSETKLNTEGIAAGFYLLRVEDERGVRNFKVVKEN